MRQIKYFFLFSFITLCATTTIYLYNEFHVMKEQTRMRALLKEEKFDLVLAKYAELKAEKLKSKLAIRWKGYYKAQALEGLKQSSQAKAFWEVLNGEENLTQYRLTSSYYLGKNAISENRLSAAQEYLDSPPLNTPPNKYYIKSKMLLFEILKKQNKKEKARNLLRELLKHSKDESESQKEIEKALGDINVSLIFSRRPTQSSIYYTIQPGDTLSSIADKHGVTLEHITKANNLKSNVIHPRNRLKITPTKFTIKVSKTKNTLLLLQEDKFFKRYQVGTGKDNVTPTGIYKITAKTKNPVWYRPDGKIIPAGVKENLLGTRWLAIDFPGYGIHGTTDDSTIGSQSSAGCIRLRNPEVEELYALVPIGTPVEIVE